MRQLMFKLNKEFCGIADTVNCGKEGSDIGRYGPLGVDWHPSGAHVEPEHIEEAGNADFAH
jgi:hypothetical protein